MKKRGTARTLAICVVIGVLVILGIYLVSLTGAFRSELELPDLSELGTITVISREDGSGTKDEFQSLVDTIEEGTTTTALSTEQVLELVEEDENAIGYVAYSAIGYDYTGTVLAVDGVEPDTDTIADGSYPLCRQYLVAYSGELNDLETDFITYMRSAGQAIVAETCTTVASTTSFLSNQEAGSIVISGSSSMASLMEALVEDYLTYNPNAQITIEVTDSTEGLNAAMRGDCDLAMSSRSLKDYEEELLEYKVIAADGVAIVVNAENPLTEITTELLQTIYDGDVTEWADLN